jgi:uncharacterized protein
MNLEALSVTLAVCRLDPKTALSALLPWASRGEFFTISRTNEELSIVCSQDDVPQDLQNLKIERNWRCLKVKGPLDFSLTGVMASLAGPLAEAKISIFAISTFDTDYLLITQQEFERAIVTLIGAGHSISGN